MTATRRYCNRQSAPSQADRVVTGYDPIKMGLGYRTHSTRVALLEPSFCVCVLVLSASAEVAA